MKFFALFAFLLLALAAVQGTPLSPRILAYLSGAGEGGGAVESQAAVDHVAPAATNNVAVIKAVAG